MTSLKRSDILMLPRKRTTTLLFFLYLGVVVFTQSYHGTVIKVTDGDTYVFQTQEGSFIVRMSWIDAPESKQPYGKESTEFLTKYLYKDAITKLSGTDRYGRRIGILFLDGQDINWHSIKRGFSWHYKQYSKDKKYAKAEKYARRKKIGLWKLDNPVPPWEWRK